jgi:hypothetical protein
MPPLSRFLRERSEYQWEYGKLDLNDAPRKADEIDVLNDAGKEGWELDTGYSTQRAIPTVVLAAYADVALAQSMRSKLTARLKVNTALMLRSVRYEGA